MNKIEHDQNGPFVRAHNASPEAQTETVYAVEVMHNGVAEHWDVSATPFTEKRYADTRRLAYRVKPGSDVRRVSRTVTITASEWISTEGDV
jgi:hypothetical protein